MEGMVIKEGCFPHRRKTLCCGKMTIAGDSVLVIEHRQGGALKGHTILHKRCVEALCETLPVDASDSKAQFKELREQMLHTGSVFPERCRKGPKRGVAIDIASKATKR